MYYDKHGKLKKHKKDKKHKKHKKHDLSFSFDSDIGKGIKKCGKKSKKVCLSVVIITAVIILIAGLAS
jgi:hypothetical protein